MKTLVQVPKLLPAEETLPFPPGPWDGEPDRTEWRHCGLPCLVRRGLLGALCGYAGVPPGHPAHGRSHGDLDLSAHGGLTYSGPCMGEICHVAQPGEAEPVWWFGFDCARGGDLVPGLVALEALSLRPIRSSSQGRDLVPGLVALEAPPGIAAALRKQGTYRDLGYVRAEVERLAEQLAEMAG